MFSPPLSSPLLVFLWIWPRAIIYVRSAASNIVYVRRVGGPENNSNIGERPNINIWCDPLDPHTLTAPVDFVSSKYLWDIFGSDYHFTENSYIINSETIVDVNNYIPFSIINSQTIDVM